MTLFKSKLSKVETFVNTKADERTPDMLQAAQDEMDRNNGDVILVPKTDTIKTAADLQAHIDKLQKDASDMKAAKEAAETAKASAEAEVAKMKGQRVLPTHQPTSSKEEGGDNHGGETPEQKEQKEKMEMVANLPHNQRLRRILDEE